jgi:hypothetical protein
MAEGSTLRLTSTSARAYRLMVVVSNRERVQLSDGSGVTTWILFGPFTTPPSAYASSNDWSIGKAAHENRSDGFPMIVRMDPQAPLRPPARYALPHGVDHQSPLRAPLPPKDSLPVLIPLRVARVVVSLVAVEADRPVRLVHRPHGFSIGKRPRGE